MSRRLYVGNLPFQTTEQALEELFAQAGAVESVRVMRDQATGQARGFAFVEMTTDEAAEAAIQKFHQQDFGGRALTVNHARPQAMRPGGGGGRDFGGGGGGRGGPRGPRREPRW
jgi:RNA recognition motif-containing protein